MPRLIWSPPALDDVQRLYRFLLTIDEEAARRAIKSIRAGVKILGVQPGAGRPINDMELEFREWVIEFGNSGYVVLYRVEHDSVILLAVRHQKEAGY